MKRLLIIIGLVVLQLPLSVGMKKANLIDFCSIYGSVYFVQNRSEAHFSVYFQEEEGVDDLTVYFQDSEAFADQPGMWFETDVPGFARFLIYKEPVLGHQDFTVFVTDVESFAGCR